MAFQTVEEGTVLIVSSASCKKEPSKSVTLPTPFLVEVVPFRGEDAPFFLLPGVFFAFLGIVVKICLVFSSLF